MLFNSLTGCKIRRKVLFKSFLVTLGKYFQHSRNSRKNSCLGLHFLFLKLFLMDQLLLPSGLEFALPILSMPLPTINANKVSSSMHLMVLPLPLINSSISKLIHTWSVLFVIFPLTFVDWATSVFVCPVTLHFVLGPRTSVGLGRGG